MPNNNFISNIFSIEEKDRTTPVSGFLNEPVFTTIINDGDLAKDQPSINKMCTSIPTPFARLFIFHTAFKEVQERQDIYKAYPKWRRVHEETRLYNYMVSDCLDMLEFIFYYGAQREFGVVQWNPNTELNMLSDESNPRFEGTPEHKRLAKALKDHLAKDETLKNLDSIYLFTWDDNPSKPNPVIIGGTSPFSLVYTSPNWVREKHRRRWAFQAGKAGEDLFENDPTHLAPPRALSQRSDRFKTYIYKMWKAYQGQHDSLKDFFTYVEQSWLYYDEDTAFGQAISPQLNSYTSSDFTSDYPLQLHTMLEIGGKLQDSSIDAKVKGEKGKGVEIPLRCKSQDDYIVNDDYCIALPANDNELPKERVGANAPAIIKRPLFLDRNKAITNASYVEDESWAQYSGRMASYQALPANYWERTLPGTRCEHPFLCIDDFLGEKIIGVAGNLSNKHFLTGNVGGDIAYLPPLKRTFFKFFKLNDIFEINSNGSIKTDENGLPCLNKRQDYFHLDVVADKVTATLNIPLKCGQNMTVSRTYEYHDDPARSTILHLDDAESDAFNLSIFPFYELIDDNARFNKYSVMLGYAGRPNDIKLNFYSSDDLNNKLNVTSKERTESNMIKTRYYDVNQSFNLIEVEINGATGLVVPLFKRKVLGNRKLVFCVDFGTTNTHIAWGVDGSDTVDDVSDFTYQESDSQVVSLYEIGGYLQYKPTFKREFVPETIGQTPTNANSANSANQFVAFPIRTSACTSKQWEQNNTVDTYQLFADANVGFYFLNEENALDGNNRYVQDVKWGNGGKSPQLRKAFFEEIMWMIKNKAVMNDGTLDFMFYFTYPQSMLGNAVDELHKAWREARLKVKAGDPDTCNMNRGAMRKPLEGIVPWYALRKTGVIKAADTYLNVDIGGGTIDMVYQNPDDIVIPSFSARFAADDLWGDGIDKMADNKKKNAFIQDYANSFPDAHNLKQRYDVFFKNASDSADIISFLFKYDDEYRFSSYLQESPLMTLLLMHFGAIAYYIGLVLKKNDFEVPQKIGFTGMGSLYIKIISPVENDIAEIIKSMLRYQGFDEKRLDNLKVVLNNNPKVITARGGVVFHHPADTGICEPSYVWGYDGEGSSDTLLEKDVDAKKMAVLKNTEHFIKYFGSNEFSTVKAKLNRGWKFKPLDYDVVAKLAKASFESWNRDNNNKGADLQQDPIFFWPIKDLLFNYGFEIIKK